MGRRRKGVGFIEIAPAIIGLIVLAGLNPQVQEALSAIATLLVWLIIFAIIFMVLLTICWIIKAHTSTNLQETPLTGAPVDLEKSDESSNRAEQDDSRYQPKPKLNFSEQLHAIDWFQFEKLIEVAYAKTHKVVRYGGANPDGGIDLMIENAEGRTAVQCKHWKSWRVGVRNVRELMGAMTDAGLKKGIIITLKGFSSDAVSLAARHEIQLIGLEELIRLVEMADQTAVQSVLSDTRKFCPKCEREMILRTAQTGWNKGRQFWGCSGYPGCTFIMK